VPEPVLDLSFGKLTRTIEISQDALFSFCRIAFNARRHDSMTDNLVSRCAIPPAAARRAKARLGLFAGYGARALRRLPPRSVVSQENTSKGTSASGKIGRCAADVHITLQTPKLSQSLRYASLGMPNAPAAPRALWDRCTGLYVLRSGAAAKPSGAR